MGMPSRSRWIVANGDVSFNKLLIDVMSESLLIDDLIRRLTPDFELRREVRGIHQLEGKGVRIDLMARGKPHLVEWGFTDQWFEIECKWADRIGGTTSKTTRMVWQSITYAQSMSTIDGVSMGVKKLIQCPPGREPRYGCHFR